ncbi:MAG: segregation/condensation protein A [Actinomycetia bacterium]|nr:segregation/condensation protein A [Actinomycetes bacterium]
MTFEVRTRVFEGPLDLLLQLITSHQVEITELSLVGIVNEYIQFIDDMTELDIEGTSEFLLIAATLIQIKARHLLPEDEPIDLDDELLLSEERDRLLARLLACLTFKDVAAVLRHRMDAATRFVPRRVGLPDHVVAPVPDVVVPVDVKGLAAIAERVFSTQYAEPDVDHLDLDLPSVQDAMVDLQGRMAATVTSDFDDIVAHCTRDVEVVAYFLALLELARWGIVKVEQREMNSAISIAYDEGAAEERFRTMVGMDGQG